MAESFNNSLVRSAGIQTTSASGTVGVSSDRITGISTAGVNVGDLVVNSNFRGNTKVSSVGITSVGVNATSTNTAISTSNTQFLGVTTVYTATQKTILIGGTLSNLTNNSIDLYVEVGVGNTSALLGSKIPVPAGAAFVMSDTGKTVLKIDDEVRVYSNTNNCLDVSLSLLEGVN